MVNLIFKRGSYLLMLTSLTFLPFCQLFAEYISIEDYRLSLKEGVKFNPYNFIHKNKDEDFSVLSQEKREIAFNDIVKMYALAGAGTSSPINQAQVNEVMVYTHKLVYALSDKNKFLESIQNTRTLYTTKVSSLKEKLDQLWNQDGSGKTKEAKTHLIRLNYLLDLKPLNHDTMTLDETHQIINASQDNLKVLKAIWGEDEVEKIESAIEDIAAKEKARQEKLVKEKEEQERIIRDKEGQQKATAEQKRQEEERLASEKKQRLEHEKLENERLAQEKLAKEQEEKQKAAAEQKRQEEERLASEKKQRLEQEKLENERLAQEKLAKEQEEKQKAAAEQKRQEEERLASEEKQRLEQEKLENERLAQERLAKEKEEITYIFKNLHNKDLAHFLELHGYTVRNNGKKFKNFSKDSGLSFEIIKNKENRKNLRITENEYNNIIENLKTNNSQNYEKIISVFKKIVKNNVPENIKRSV